MTYFKFGSLEYVVTKYKYTLLIQSFIVTNIFKLNQPTIILLT